MNKQIKTKLVLDLDDVFGYELINKPTRILHLDLGEKGKMELRDEAAIASITRLLQEKWRIVE